MSMGLSFMVKWATKNALRPNMWTNPPLRSQKRVD